MDIKANKEYSGCVCIPDDIVALFGAHPVAELVLESEDGNFTVERDHIALASAEEPLWFSKSPERSWQFPDDAPDFAYWQVCIDGSWLHLPKGWVKLDILNIL